MTLARAFSGKWPDNKWPDKWPDHLPRRAWLHALVLGVIAACGFQPLGLWPLALIAMGLFALQLSLTIGWRQAAWLGWLFGVGHFTLGNSWIATAFTYQANLPPILGWPAVPLIALYLAVYPALAAGAARAIAGRRGGAVMALALAGSWIVAEWLRSWVFTGYAWNPFGVVLLGPFDRPGLAAILPWMGTYALSGLAVLIAAALMTALVQRRWLAAAFSAVLIAAGMYWPAAPAEDGPVSVTVVQPDIRQERLNDALFYESNFVRLAQLSGALDQGDTRLVLWPESGMSDYLEEGYPQAYYNRTTALGSPEYARARIGQIIGSRGMLLTGAQRLVIEDGRASAAYNSVMAVSGGGTVEGVFSKEHLVPFGEYLPMRWLLEPLGLSRLVPGSIDFLPGTGPATLDLGAHGLAGVQICYEIIFSGQVVDRAARPDYIFNPSNDGWFGSFGPPQHFAQARLRAIEEGLPVLRSTTTGISGVIDAHGVVRQYLGAHEMGRIDTRIPAAAAPTLFARLGNILALCWALVFLLTASVAMRKTAG
ncbi:apolipoprotein N-acyltransferase [Alteraurantiacibacter aestuarii]|uniref:Apolipoprotein N-acyltransferase n=1 Tax=Alteraurantiacibacter aestuarii TaxID=650004 RepID=A0A844ZHZ5_9SPHN|nr:apolipoprotein N-acyltransferase [Alteraurantiacibacter aestuarii]MXO87184.1 apolipoprotein N-acyltransferase [Alteraurantiacibacter aestuarii]